MPAGFFFFRHDFVRSPWWHSGRARGWRQRWRHKANAPSGRSTRRVTATMSCSSGVAARRSPPHHRRRGATATGNEGHAGQRRLFFENGGNERLACGLRIHWILLGSHGDGRQRLPGRYDLYSKFQTRTNTVVSYRNLCIINILRWQPGARKHPSMAPMPHFRGICGTSPTTALPRQRPPPSDDACYLGYHGDRQREPA